MQKQIQLCKMRVSSPTYTLDLVKCMQWKDSAAFWVSNNLEMIRLHTLPLKDGNSVVWQREVQMKVTFYIQKMN